MYICISYIHICLGSRACPNDLVQRQPSERSITLKSQKIARLLHYLKVRCISALTAHCAAVLSQKLLEIRRFFNSELPLTRLGA